jgi:hypothetical protein
LDGVKFVAEDEFAFLIEDLKVIKVGNGFGIESHECC